MNLRIEHFEFLKGPRKQLDSSSTPTLSFTLEDITAIVEANTTHFELNHLIIDELN